MFSVFRYIFLNVGPRTMPSSHPQEQVGVLHSVHCFNLFRPDCTYARRLSSSACALALDAFDTYTVALQKPGRPTFLTCTLQLTKILPLSEAPGSDQCFELSPDGVGMAQVQMVFSIKYEGLANRQQVRRQPAPFACSTVQHVCCSCHDVCVLCMADTASSRLGRPRRRCIDSAKAAKNH